MRSLAAAARKNASSLAFSFAYIDIYFFAIDTKPKQQIKWKSDIVFNYNNVNSLCVMPRVERWKLF